MDPDIIMATSGTHLWSNADHYGLQEPSRLTMLKTTEQSIAEKRRLDREGCFSDSVSELRDTALRKY